MTVTEVMSARAAAYQARVTGTKQGTAYVVDGVKFDGFSNGLLKWKQNYSQFVRRSISILVERADGFVQQAQRQLAAAKGIQLSGDSWKSRLQRLPLNCLKIMVLKE